MKLWSVADIRIFRRFLDTPSLEDTVLPIYIRFCIVYNQVTFQVELEMSKYTGIDLDWDKIYRLSSETTSLLVNEVSNQVEIFLIASTMAAMAKASLEDRIAREDWNDKERSSFWNDIETETQKHEAFIRETMNHRKAKTSGSIEDSSGEQLHDKYEELRVIVARCDLDEKDVREDIAVSMEEANKLIESVDPPAIPYGWWAAWWHQFLKEWAGKCFVKYTDKSREVYPHILYSNYEEMRDLWLSEFEPLWAVGCDMARLSQMNSVMKSMTKFISGKTYDENQKQSIWKWVNGLDEIASDISDSFRQKQRKVFDSSLEWLKGRSKDYIYTELKRLLSN